MLLGPRSIAVSHRVVLCIAQFPGGSHGPVRVVRETEACSLCPDDSVLRGNGRYTPLRRDATNALRKRSTATGIPLSPSVPSARQTHSGSDWCRQLQGFYLAGLHHLAKHRTELAVAIMQQVATGCQKTPILHRYVSRLLLHPLLVRIRRDPGQASAPRLQLDEEKHVVRD